MIEEPLLAYGPLGLWTISLLYERYITQKKLISVIEKNTAVMASCKLNQNMIGKKQQLNLRNNAAISA